MPKKLDGKARAVSVSVRDGEVIRKEAEYMAQVLSDERGERVDQADVMYEAFECYRLLFYTGRDAQKHQFKG